MREPGDGSPALPGRDIMKKTVKKLVLAKETLLDLESGVGRIAGGGGVSGTGCGGDVCPWTGYRTCNTCNNNTCGTNLC